MIDDVNKFDKPVHNRFLEFNAETISSVISDPNFIQSDFDKAGN